VNKIRIPIIIVLVTMLTGCVGFKFTYNNLDWIVPWYVDDYLALTDQQEEQFDQAFGQLWVWHRSIELPKYASLLSEIKSDVSEQALTQQKLTNYRDQMKNFYRETAKQAIISSADLLASISDEQINEIQLVIEDERLEFEEYIKETNTKSRTKKRIRAREKEYRKWFGKLTNKQKKLIQTWGNEIETSLEYRYEYFTNSRTAFLKALSNRSNKELMLSELLYLVDERDEFHNANYLEIRDRNRQRVDKLLLDLQDSLTKKQKRRLLNRIENYRELFEDLSSN